MSSGAAGVGAAMVAMARKEAMRIEECILEVECGLGGEVVGE